MKLNEQEQFEAWFRASLRGKGCSLAGVLAANDRPKPGFTYAHPWANLSWEAWQAAAADPQGWRLVPVVPTREMLDAGHHRIDFDRSDQNTYHLEHESQGRSTILRDMTEAWAAMLDAAPRCT